ncbi:HAMP domain-containing sensor histidine kinase [Clostridium sediminicola]|uniref:HAMP domain-containing sensor histidine kinase n=1 Tax=Clostridium sediminicola TaxID=3114879 RepID=UPI0031F22396
MNKNFNNPELKKSSIILLFSTILFFSATIFVLNLYHKNLKEDYIKSLGVIANRVIEKDPELEKEIIPLITKEINEDDVVKGKELLKQYGIDSDLENKLFPYVNRTIERNIYFLTIIFIFLFVFLFIMNYLQHLFFYNRVRAVTLGARKVIKGDYSITIDENKEGDISKLASSFNSMKDIIRSNIDNLKSEKNFLVNLLSDISHQLKTPLSSMIVYNDILLNKELSDEQRKSFLRNNEIQLYRMDSLIKSLLKLAKLDAKAIELNKSNLSLNDTIQESIDALVGKANDKNIDIEFIENKEIYMCHDKLWLEEALINVLKNSIEHTDQSGKATIEMIQNPLYTRIIIEDTGEGIKEEDLPNIFKRFYKSKTSKKNDSVGIGLALAKSIVEAHGGIIEVQSKINVGTKFFITFMEL